VSDTGAGARHEHGFLCRGFGRLQVIECGNAQKREGRRQQYSHETPQTAQAIALSYSFFVMKRTENLE
jgi:hypothetical protein